MKQFLMGSAAVIAVAIPGAAFAQSTGSQDFEDTIVVTGATADQGVGGVKIPDSPKAKVVLTQEIIERQRPGQTVNEIINLVPGVSFANNDPWGSSGGSFTIRGFNSDRISQTFDGIPLNDSGNYALYTNQMVDPEIIEDYGFEEIFEKLSESALGQNQVFVHRDFHSRNILLSKKGEMGVLDFQDAVVGPITYDLVSLLKDCSSVGRAQQLTTGLIFILPG